MREGVDMEWDEEELGWSHSVVVVRGLGYLTPEDARLACGTRLPRRLVLTLLRLDLLVDLPVVRWVRSSRLHE